MVSWWLQGKVSWWRLAFFIITSFNDTFAEFDSPVTFVVTVTSPVTKAKNPLAVPLISVWNLTVMVVPVTGPGVEPQ